MAVFGPQKLHLEAVDMFSYLRHRIPSGQSFLRVILSIWVPMCMCSCSLVVTPDPSNGDGTATIGKAGDPHTLIVKNNSTGETTTFVIHEESDDNELVMASVGPDEEEEVQTRIRLDRSILEDLDLRDLPGNFVALEHNEDEEDHPGMIELLQATAHTGTVTHSINYVHPESGIDFDIIAVVEPDKLDAQSQIAVGTVIIVVTSIAAGVCLAELIISVLATDCNTNCSSTCGSRGVQKCSLDVNFGVQRSPFKVGCFTSCDTVCH
jgi:hypothetical protein